jgi:hypothetical protein
MADTLMAAPSAIAPPASTLPSKRYMNIIREGGHAQAAHGWHLVMVCPPVYHLLHPAPLHCTGSKMPARQQQQQLC